MDECVYDLRMLADTISRGADDIEEYKRQMLELASQVIQLQGLFEENFGIKTWFTKHGLRWEKNGKTEIHV